jgi:hypothetical protein
MDTRICNICNLEKPLSDEYYRKSVFIKKDGSQNISFMNRCLDCHRVWQRENYLKKQTPKEDDGYSICKYCEKKYLQAEFETAFMCVICFKIKKSEQDKNYNKAHKIEKAVKDKEYRIQNKEQLSLKQKAYYQSNKSKYIERNVRNEIKRRANDPIFKLRKAISAGIRKAISKRGESFTKYLPYSVQDLKEHLEKQFEPWMSWSNQGVYKVQNWNDNDPSTWKWNVDHIIPHSTFKYISMDNKEFKDCWALSNLRPYSAKQNVIDGVRL